MGQNEDGSRNHNDIVIVMISIATEAIIIIMVIDSDNNHNDGVIKACSCYANGRTACCSHLGTAGSGRVGLSHRFVELQKWCLDSFCATAVGVRTVDMFGCVYSRTTAMGVMS